MLSFFEFSFKLVPLKITVRPGDASMAAPVPSWETLPFPGCSCTPRGLPKPAPQNLSLPKPAPGCAKSSREQPRDVCRVTGSSPCPQLSSHLVFMFISCPTAPGAAACHSISVPSHSQDSGVAGLEAQSYKSRLKTHSSESSGDTSSLI